MINDGTPDHVSKIELAIAVRIGTGELEESSCRWIQLMRLGGWRVRTGAFKPELEPQLLNAGECRPQGERRCAAAPQPFATGFRRRGRFVGVESHDESSPLGAIVG